MVHRVPPSSVECELILCTAQSSDRVQKLPSASAPDHDSVTVLDLLQLYAKHKDLRKARSVHADILEQGLFPKDAYISTALLNTYAKCGAFEESQIVFCGLQERGVVSLNALISGYAQNGLDDKAMEIFNRLGEHCIFPDPITYASILKACGNTRSLEIGERVHSNVTKQGILENDIVLGTALLDMYVKCGALDAGQKVFDVLLARNIVSWNALIAGYTRHGLHNEALDAYSRMQDEGISPDLATFVCVLKACGNTKSVVLGEDIHLKVNEKGLLVKDVRIGTALVDMYSKCGLLQKAQEVFDSLPLRDVVSWSALITGYTEDGLADEALKCFRQMKNEGVTPDSVTFICLLKACGILGSLEVGEELYAEIIRLMLLKNDVSLGNTLVDTFAKCGSFGKAHEVFDKLETRDVVSWNALINGYNQHGLSTEALNCFKQMQGEGIFPNVITFTCILKACSNTQSLEVGEEIHAEISRQRLLGMDIMLGIALMEMYARCGVLNKAQNVFRELPLRDAMTWGALISGYVHHELADEALVSVKQMQAEGISPDVSTLNCILKVCGDTGFVEIGEEVHVEIYKWRLLEKDAMLCKTLVAIYAECGVMVKAHQMFDQLVEKDVVSWSSLMAGYAQSGQAHSAINLFRKMIIEDIFPDEICFLVLLTACSHAGLVEEGQTAFSDMDTVYQLTPTLAHYASMVDLFSRTGHLNKALAVIENVPACAGF